MNNSSFRSLIDTDSSKRDASHSKQHAKFKRPAAALGSRMRSAIPMTPRNLPGRKYNVKSEFERQVAEEISNKEGYEGPPLKKFKSSAAPKGTKVASGYIDRASLLRGDDRHGIADVDDREKRLNALEEMLKLQQIDQATFEKLREQIGVGGDVGSTHLVKGLDWKLLARVRRGEDISKSSDDAETVEPQDLGAIDEEFDKELAKVTSENPKKLTDAQTDEGSPPVEGTVQSLTRDEILRRLKESRQNPQTEASHPRVQEIPTLNAKFKRVPTQNSGPTKEKFTETVNGRRREVLLITYPDGSTKRKTKWIDREVVVDEQLRLEEQKRQHVRESPGDNPGNKAKKPQANVLGSDVSASIAAKIAEKQLADAAEGEGEDDDDDIFQGAGVDYDPLANIESDASDTNDEEKDKPKSRPSTASTATQEVEDKDVSKPVIKRNYFSSTTKTKSMEHDTNLNPMTKDPSILAALKRAAEIRKREEQEENKPDAYRTINKEPNGDKSKAFLAKLRERDRQDAADLDMGFGGSRFDDEDDEVDARDLLDYNDNGEGDTSKNGSGSGKSARKRGPKKRKGDKNNFSDVMGAIEARKK